MMHTRTQCEELISYTFHGWTTINGVNGYKFISNTDSSKSIFLPAGGYWNETSYNWTKTDGLYWTTATRTYGDILAKTLHFNSTNIYISQDGTYRGCGVLIRSIRPRTW